MTQPDPTQEGQSRHAATDGIWGSLQASRCAKAKLA